MVGMKALGPQPDRPDAVETIPTCRARAHRIIAWAKGCDMAPDRLVDGLEEGPDHGIG